MHLLPLVEDRQDRVMVQSLEKDEVSIFNKNCALPKYNLTRVSFLLHMVLHHPLEQVHEWRLWALAALLVSAMLLPWNEAKCDFSAMFNFGDSNSDTGGFFAAFPAATGPYGMTHFGRPTGRASDGRLVVDFLGFVGLLRPSPFWIDARCLAMLSKIKEAQAFGFPYLSPYLQSIGSNYKHGANYATLASTVLMPNTSLFVSGISPFFLAIQLNQMKDFKARALHRGPNARLPSPDVFGSSLYTFDIGQNDFTSNLEIIGISGVKKYLPQVVQQIADTIKALHAEGARTFWVFNLAPIGCYPAFLTTLPHKSSDLDEYGCLSTYNNAVLYYNKLLKKKLKETRVLMSNASVIYVDTHSVKLELFRHPSSHGLLYGTKACCGYGGDPYNYYRRVFCGNTKVINGSTVTATACSDPQNYVSWDGIHATEVANKIVTRAVLSGDYFDPPFPLSQLCDLKPIG